MKSVLAACLISKKQLKIMTRIIYLPSYQVSGENETSLTSDTYKHCQIDTDCPQHLICYNVTGLTWLKGNKINNFDFYQHDDVQGSMNYIKLENKPAYNFCGCSILGGWTGYDCSVSHGSNQFELFIQISAVLVMFVVFVLGLNALRIQVQTHGFQRIRTRTSIAMVFCVFGALFVVIARSIHVYNISNPLKYSVLPGGKKSNPLPKEANNFTNNFVFVFFVASILQISYCWIEVSQNVAKMKKKKGEMALLEKIVLGYEIIFIFVTLGL